MKLHASATLRDAIEIFHARNLAGQIADGRNGKLVMLSDARVGVILSHVRAGLKRATGIDDRKALNHVALRPYLEALPDLAYRYAKEAETRKAACGWRGSSQAANYRSDVATFLRVVEGIAPDARGHKRRVSAEAFVTAWRPLGDALLGGEDEGSRFRRYAGWLE